VKDGRDTEANDECELARGCADREVGVEVSRGGERDIGENPGDYWQTAAATRAERDVSNVVGRDKHGGLLADNEAKGSETSRCGTTRLDSDSSDLPRVDDGEQKAVVGGCDGENARLPARRTKGGHMRVGSGPTSAKKVRPDEGSEVGGA
jgi:hypothetical protein